MSIRLRPCPFCGGTTEPKKLVVNFSDEYLTMKCLVCGMEATVRTDDGRVMDR